LCAKRPGGGSLAKRAAPSGRYLSLEERLQIADLHLGGVTVSAIATGIGRSWFVQTTRSVSEHDFTLLTGRV